MRTFCKNYLILLEMAILGKWVSQKEKRWSGCLFKEIVVENFSNLENKLDISVHETKRTANYLSAKRFSPRHILKLSIKNFKGNRRKRLAIRLPVDSSAESLQARRKWNAILKSLKDKNRQPEVLCLAKLSLTYGEIKTFPDKQNLREFVNSGGGLGTKSCPTLEIPWIVASFVHGILQAKILEWIISFSRESSQPRNRTHISCSAGRFFTG